MVIGILQVELVIDGAQSLKDKRRVVLSFKDKLRRDFNVSIAEIATQDNPRVATLGLAVVTNEVPHCQSMLDNILDRFAQARDCVLHDHTKEILTGH